MYMIDNIVNSVQNANTIKLVFCDLHIYLYYNVNSILL